MRFAHPRLLPFAAAVLLFAVLPLNGAEGERRSDRSGLFSAEQYTGWIEYLASDDLEGRGTGQEGIDKAADYIASVWGSMGVRPAGDDDSYFQNFELPLGKQIGATTRLAIGTRGRNTRKPAELDVDFRPLPFSSSGSFRGEVVFAGYGIVNDGANYNDYADLDVKDKIVIVIRRGPDFGEFNMGEISFRAKSQRASERGAAALLIVNRDNDATLYDFDRDTGRGGDHGIPMMHITPALADQMLAAGGLPSIESLQAKIEETKKPASAVLQGVSAGGRVDIEPIMSPVRNVVGMIPGTGPQAGELVVLGAHYDHLGIRNKGKADFDPSRDISNGADDNASGTAMLMQLAKAYTDGPSPNRTLVLIAFTGEEMGLLGSEHFAKTPTVDLDSCIAMLNFDMVGRLKDNLLEVGGMKTGGFEDTIHRLAEPYGFDIRDGGGGRGPSDHTHFYLRDIPVLFFFTGLHRQYHRPEDDTPLINAEGSMRIARFACDVIDALDREPKPPVFARDTRRARIGRQSEAVAKANSSAPGGRPRDTAAATPQPTTERGGAPVRLGVMPSSTADGKGVLVDGVNDDSPAANAGIRPGDRIVRIGPKRVRSLEDAMAALGDFKNGDRTRVRVLRGGEMKTLEVTFGDAMRPVDAPGTPAKPGDRLESKVMDRIIRDLNANGFKSRMSNVTMKGGTNGFELSVTIEAGDAEGTLVGDLLGSIAESVESHSKQTGVFYDFEVGAAMEFNAGAKPTMTVSIKVEEPKAPDAGVHNPHARGTNAPAANAHANPHGAARGDAHADAHGAADDVENNTMPPVRLGIMPTYGASEGEGFEIAGVVEGGAAEKGGMKDKDRILSIGGHTVSDVYTYMDALRKCKPGEKIKVVVLRDGKRVELTLVTAAPETREAA